jgi:hypothetical protein
MEVKETKVEQSTEKDVAFGDSRDIAGTHDIGANLYLEAEQLTAAELETEGAQVLKILDWRIMPMVGDPWHILCVIFF